MILQIKEYCVYYIILSNFKRGQYNLPIFNILYPWGCWRKAPTYLRRLTLMKSSGRRRNLKYHKNLRVSPMKGRPKWPGGNLVFEAKHLALRGTTYRSSFHHHNANPTTTHTVTKPNHTDTASILNSCLSLTH